VAGTFANLTAASRSTDAKEAKKVRRIGAGWMVPAPPPEVIWTHREIGSVAPAPVTFEWAGDRLRHAGTALHGFLEKIARAGLNGWNENVVRSHRAAYQAVLTNLGLSPSDLAEAVQDVETGLLQTLRDPRGRWILEPQVEAECELQITGVIDGKLYEIAIDRTFVDESGVRWIIDYKTSAHEGGRLEAFLDNEKERYREQLERYARLMTQRDDRPIRLGLYFPLLSAWREWAAPVVLRKQTSLCKL
jgi:hypothetical protein